MDQIKIGKFIAELRKQKGYTQAELANVLGVTDRAISKWENGRGMPDFSLIVPLCDALDISVSDFFNGETVKSDKENESGIINSLEYSQYKVKDFKKKILFIILSFILAFVLLVSAFATDIVMMRNNKPVIFSTWGFDYAPPVDFTDYEIELAIKDYLIGLGDSEYHHNNGVKTFVATKIYLIEEYKEDINNIYIVYAWVLSEQCYLENNDVMNYSSYSVPHKFTVKEDPSYKPFEYIVEKAEFPRDGFYSEDMKSLFPKSVIKDMEMFHKDGSFEILQNEINEQVKLYFNK